MSKVEVPLILPDEQYLTTTDVARRIGRSADRVRQLRRAGQLSPVYITAGGIAVYRLADVEAYILERDNRDAA
jgi:hypothetical protein